MACKVEDRTGLNGRLVGEVAGYADAAIGVLYASFRGSKSWRRRGAGVVWMGVIVVDG
jgi:hypothetical protein